MNTEKGLTAAVAEVLISEKATTSLTYDALAELTGLSRSQVIRYFKGQRSMTLAELEVFCGILNLDLFEVIARAHARIKKSATV